MKMEEKNQIIPVLLCGGSGSRLWPMSRKSYPKQFLKCNPNSEYSFLQETQIRISKINNIDDPIIICNVEHRFIVAEQMREINVKPKVILLEPIGRNTAPAIALASLKSLEIQKDPLLLFLPSDHSVENIKEFVETINKSKSFAEKGNIVTYGIPPSEPETGYGYIEVEDKIINQKDDALEIKRFVEKPDKKTAQDYYLSHKYYWNSGIFLLKAKVALRDIKKYSPNIFESCEASIKQSIFDLDFQRIDKKSFFDCPNVSFDIAVMERTKVGKVFPLIVNWSDIGNWDSLWKISKKNIDGNVIKGKVVTRDVSNSYLLSEDRLTVALGLSNIMIIDTEDALLVANRSYSQEVKDIIPVLKKEEFNEAIIHRKIFRPWGNYRSIAEGNGWQVKCINVNPNSSLSLQKHNHRTEHWIIVSGSALVEVGKTKKILKENQSTYIPLGCIHRLSNPNNENLILIEVQSGAYLGEDDIIRFEDNYGRID